MIAESPAISDVATLPTLPAGESSFDDGILEGAEGDTPVNPLAPVGNADTPVPIVSEPGMEVDAVVQQTDEVQPEVSRPDVPQPDVSQPEVSQPEAPQAEVSQPEAPELADVQSQVQDLPPEIPVAPPIPTGEFPAGARVVDIALTAPSALLPARSSLSGEAPVWREMQPGERVRLQPPGTDTWLARITSNARFNTDNGDATHFYSRRQAWNADESLLLTANRLLDADTFELRSGPLSVSTSRSWSHRFANILYGIRFNNLISNTFGYVNVDTGRYDPLVQFSEYETCRLGNGEGSLSVEDRYVLINCDTIAGGDLLWVDVYAGRVLATLPLEPSFNWASISPSGRYALLEYSAEGEGNRRLLRYDLSQGGFSGAPVLLSELPNHGDICISPAGEELFVMINQKTITASRLSDGLRIDAQAGLFDRQLGFGHVSCRNSKRPGWAYFSANSAGWIGALSLAFETAEPASSDEQAVSSFNGPVEFWGTHQSSLSTYEATPKLSVSPSGRQVIYSSDWNGTGETADFVSTPIGEGAGWPGCLGSAPGVGPCGQNAASPDVTDFRSDLRR